MAIGRDDRYVTDAQGNALSGALVYYCTQPASTASLPPSPLATVYSDIPGDAGVNPVTTDGFGHSVAYLNNSVLYTVVLSHPLFGANPIVLPDQTIPGAGGGGAITPFSGVPTGTVDGTNRVFTVVNGSTPLTSIPTQLFATFNGSFLTLGLGYTLAVVSGQLKITYATAPQPASGSIPGDNFFVQGLL